MDGDERTAYVYVYTHSSRSILFIHALLNCDWAVARVFRSVTPVAAQKWGLRNAAQKHGFT